jgi:hypothetical protein
MADPRRPKTNPEGNVIPLPFRKEWQEAQTTEAKFDVLAYHVDRSLVVGEETRAIVTQLRGEIANDHGAVEREIHLARGELREGQAAIRGEVGELSREVGGLKLVLLETKALTIEQRDGLSALVELHKRTVAAQERTASAVERLDRRQEEDREARLQRETLLEKQLQVAAKDLTAKAATDKALAVRVDKQETALTRLNEKIGELARKYGWQTALVLLLGRLLWEWLTRK